MPMPERFSTRAASYGDTTGARKLEFMEAVAELLVRSQCRRSLFDVGQWESALTEARYPRAALEGVLHAIRWGATIDPAPELPLREPIHLANHSSIFQNVQFVRDAIHKQFQERTMYEWPAQIEGQAIPKPHAISPIGLVVKHEMLEDEKAFNQWIARNSGTLTEAAARDARGESADWVVKHLEPLPTPKGKRTWRIIHDARVGVNDRGEPPPTGDNDTLRAFVRQLRPGYFMFTEDIKGAFKTVTVIPHQTVLNACSFEGRVLVDSTLVFGTNRSPGAFRACVADPLQWLAEHMAEREGLGQQGALLRKFVDDNFGAAPTKTHATAMHGCFLRACSTLNIKLKEEKSSGVVQAMRLLGLDVSTTEGKVTVSCPKEKIEKIRDTLREAERKREISVKELESVLGMIQFVAVSIDGASVFSGELLGCLRNIPRSPGKGARGKPSVQLTTGMTEDISFWCAFAEEWNGVEQILPEPTLPIGHLSADAYWTEEAAGIGLFMEGKGFHIALPGGQWTQIARLELAAQVLLLILFSAEHFDEVERKPHHVVALCDSSNALSWVAKGHGQPPEVARVLRLAWRVGAVTKTIWSSRFTRTEDNQLGDAASRNDHTAFAIAMSHYSPIPSSLHRPGPISIHSDAVHNLGRYGKITSIDPTSLLYTLATHLGGRSNDKLPSLPQEVVGVLRKVRSELTIP